MLRNFSISQRIIFFVIIMIALIISIAGLSVRMTEGVIADGTALAKEMLLDSQRARIKDITHSQALGLAAMTQGQPEAEQLRIDIDAPALAPYGLSGGLGGFLQLGGSPGQATLAGELLAAIL